ncbi:hypothetical protein F5Y19DRAFT_447828 [Xylariaceae sp. FL1651]|nr:hypothetical protein F5Y19DRAFT_447828 [Xylariaceae sp. FL1651]
MTMQPGKYHRILPAVPAAQVGEPSALNSPDHARIEVSAKKRLSSQQRPGACVECRNRKIKCDGARPACSSCAKRGVVLCTYPERLVSGHNTTELVDLFKYLPEDRAMALLRSLREKGDTATVVADFRNVGDESSSPPGPHSRGSKLRLSSLEGELMANNSKTYPALPRINPLVLARSNLLRPMPAPKLSNQSDRPSNSRQPTEQLVKYCDERLRSLQVAFWTDIKVSNDFAARVISLYIQTDHPLLGLFDTHLLVTDLVDQRTAFCSRLLFHALMYIGCQMYSAFDEAAIQYASGFCDEAEALWMTEHDSYLSMASAILLSISLMGNGKDHAVLRYATEAMDMGERLGLFSTEHHSARAQQPSVDIPDDDMSAKCYAAWGVFNWNVIISLFYRQPGSETPISAPSVPIPGDMSTKKRHKQVSEEESLPSEELLGKTFPILCQFWSIVHKARWIYYAVQESPPVYLRTSLVEYAYRELIAWAENLPLFLLRREQSPHYVTVFHIWLHTAILDMFQPFIYKAPDEVPQLNTFSARDRTPDSVYTTSTNQLKYLIVQYRSKYAASTYSILWHTGLIYLANAMLRGTDPEWRLYLLLCIYGYERLNRPYRISEVVTQGLLSMAMRDTDMTGSEAHKIMKELKERGLDRVKEDLEDNIRATFMVDLNLALTNPEAANAEQMAGDFDDFAVLQDLFDLNRAPI